MLCKHLYCNYSGGTVQFTRKLQKALAIHCEGMYIIPYILLASVPVLLNIVGSQIPSVTMVLLSKALCLKFLLKERLCNWLTVSLDKTVRKMTNLIYCGLMVVWVLGPNTKIKEGNIKTLLFIMVQHEL